MSSETDPTDAKPSLPKLLASLALGARSVNALPFTRENNDADDDGDNDDDEDEEDEFSFLMSLPEFSTLNNDARQSLSSLLFQALEGLPSDDNDTIDTEYEFELWERCADTCDALYDRVTTYINEEQRRQQSSGGGGGNDTNYETLASAISNVSQRARTNASGAYGRMIQGLADMEKPQNVYQGFVTMPPQNSREEPFTPVIVYDGNKQGKLDGGEFTKEGHGLESRFDNGGGDNGEGGESGRDVTRRKYSPDMIAPSHHYEHPYREDIEALEYRPWQLDVSDIDSKDPSTIAQQNKSGDGVWIGNEEDLAQLAMRITEGQENGEIEEIALDLEAHSHRTFAGFVCLIQLSIRRTTKASSDNSQEQSARSDIATGYDFLIDALSLRHAIPTHLGPILVNPNILKVMHGADSDIPWLQGNFGCYVVNLFDTGRAARALKFPSAGLAYLLRKYAGVEADKAHQLSDWRRRPLPEDMRSYAVSDTRYLLDIYDQLRLELEGHSFKDISIASVLDRSKQVCLIRYDKEPFRPSGYQSIVDGRNGRRRNSSKNSKVTSELSSQQEAALKALYDWRDRTARQEDESVGYVCSNAALLRISSNRPVTVAALQRLVNPLPPLVMRRSQEILNAIKVSTGEKSKGADTGVTKAAASKLAVPPAPASRNREMLSPILGSEALYQQAGWMTPTLQGGTGSSESEDEGIRTFLDVNAANQGHSATNYSTHGIEMSPPSLENDSYAMEDNTQAKRSSRGASTDGLGTARAAMGSDGSSTQEDAKVAQRSANFIQKEMVKLTGSGNLGKFGNGFSLIDLIRPIPMSEDIEFDKDQETNRGGDISSDNHGTPEAAPEEEEELIIPKSMREIYNLSNANRRRTSKEKIVSKPLEFPDDDNDIQMVKEDFVSGAEAVIASRGGPGGYFGSSSTKRQRTVASGKEGDIKLMTKMGWVKDKKDAESLAVVPNDTQAAEKDKNSNGSHYKKPSASGGRGSGGGGSFEYNYAGNQPLFDPAAAPSKNPFFAGAATGAASMLHGESKGKSQKRNKKR